VMEAILKELILAHSKNNLSIRLTNQSDYCIIVYTKS
jgi:hypothetical protein